MASVPLVGGAVSPYFTKDMSTFIPLSSIVGGIIDMARLLQAGCGNDTEKKGLIIANLVNLIVLFLLVLYMYGKAIHTLDMVAKFAILLATANIVLSALLFAPV
eukprot:m.41313 g.41313  ORF g.41313 m.41313 type:complete len:104 (-) comp8198_c0_seq1:1553-1864(-)